MMPWVVRGLLGVALAALLWSAHAQQREKPVVFPQLGHSGAVRDAVFSPDGRHLVVAEGRAFKVWEAARWRELRTVRGHTGEINALAMSPDGRTLASGSEDGAVVLWDWLAGQVLKRLAAPDAGGSPSGNSVYAVQFSADGRLLAASGSFGWTLWDVASGKTLAVPEIFDWPNALRFAGARRLVFAAERKIRVWDMDGGQSPVTVAEHEDSITRLWISRDGRLAASVDSASRLRVTELATGRQVFEEEATGAAISADGERLFFCRRDGSVSAFHFGARTASAAAGKCPVGTMAAMPGGRKLVGVGYVLTQLDLVTGRTDQIPLARALPATSIAALGPRELITVGHYGEVVRRWDLATGKSLGGLGGPGHFRRFALSADGRVLAVLAEGPVLLNPDPRRFSSGIRIIDVESGAVRLIADWPLQSIALSADGRVVLAHLGQDVKIWDATTGKLLRRLPIGDFPNALALSPDGAHVLVAGLTGERVWRVADGALLWHRPLKAYDQAWAGVFSADGLRLFLGSATGRIVELDVASGKTLRALEGHASLVNALSPSPDGTLLASAAWDHTLRVWDLRDGAVREVIEGLDGPAAQIAFSSDGSRVLAAAADGSVRAWQRAGGKELARFIGFDDGEWLAITPEGFFNGSLRAPEKINVRQGTVLYPLNSFYDAFYRPDLVERKLRGEDVSPLAMRTLEEALRDPPPIVRFTAEPEIHQDGHVRVRYRISGAGGGVGAVRVFHNGKLVSVDRAASPTATVAPQGIAQITPEAVTRGLRVAASAGREAQPRDRPDPLDGQVELEAVPGANEVAVIAFNRTDSVFGEPALVRFDTAIRPIVPRLYILAVGIDQYVEQPLAFAVKDATAFAGALQKTAASLFPPENVLVRALTDHQATRSGIVEALRAIAATAKPWDTFVLFIASHGVLFGGRYAMVAQDYPGELPQGLLFADELLGLVSAIPAAHQLLVLDTCHAGGLNSLARGLYDARMAVLARSAGLHIIASASETQEALDGYQGQGLFTHAVLAAMRDPVTDRNRDRMVSIVELSERARERALEAAKKVGHRQTPVLMGFGRDVPLYRLN